jgi:ABC-type uncharacterized transport system fused permease/ATPase subunit
VKTQLCLRRFKPSLIVLDEATWALEPDMWKALENYSNTPLIMIGDKTQLRLVVVSTHKDEEVRESIRLSSFILDEVT